MPTQISGTNGVDKVADNTVQTADIADSIVTGAKLSGGQPGSAPIYGARAWVNFNGTGTPAIRASGNVSSITDNGVGDYTITFTVPLPDANYVVCGAVNGPAGDGYIVITSQTASSFRFITRTSGGLGDSTIVNVAVFR